MGLPLLPVSHRGAYLDDAEMAFLDQVFTSETSQWRCRRNTPELEHSRSPGTIWFRTGLLWDSYGENEGKSSLKTARAFLEGFKTA